MGGAPLVIILERSPSAHDKEQSRPLSGSVLRLM